MNFLAGAGSPVVQALPRVAALQHTQGTSVVSHSIGSQSDVLKKSSQRLCGATPLAALLLALSLKRQQRTVMRQQWPTHGIAGEPGNSEKTKRRRKSPVQKRQGNCAWPLAADQRFAVPTIVHHFRQGNSCVLAGRTGTGKTYVMANIYNRMRLPTVILSYTEELVQQLHAELLEHLPEDAEAGLVNQFVGAYSSGDGNTSYALDRVRMAQRRRSLDAMEKGGAHIIVGTTAVLYGSQCLLEKMNTTYGTDGWILMLDESHNMFPACGGKASKPGAPRRATWKDSIKPCRTLYVSATPREKEKEVCGHTVIDMVIRPNAIVNPDLSIEVDSEQNAVLDVLDRLDRLLASDASSQALLFMSGIKQGKRMQRVLERRGINAGHLHYQLHRNTRNFTMQNFKQGEPGVLIGTHLMKEGHSFPNVRLVCVLAYANMRYAVHFTGPDLMQIVGRATRNEDKPSVVIYSDQEKTLIRAESVKGWNDGDKLRQLQAKHGDGTLGADDGLSWPQVSLG